MNVNIIVSADHAATSMRDHLLFYLRQQGHTVIKGQNGSGVEYPRLAVEACELIAMKACDLAILCCGTGAGMAMAANRNRKIRAVVCSEPYTAKMSRMHNDANVLCLGARVISNSDAEEIVSAFLNTDFEAGRHLDRIRQFSIV